MLCCWCGCWCGCWWYWCDGTVGSRYCWGNAEAPWTRATKSIATILRHAVNAYYAEYQASMGRNGLIAQTVVDRTTDFTNAKADEVLPVIPGTVLAINCWYVFDCCYQCFIARAAAIVVVTVVNFGIVVVVVVVVVVVDYVVRCGIAVSLWGQSGFQLHVRHPAIHSLRRKNSNHCQVIELLLSLSSCHSIALLA